MDVQQAKPVTWFYRRLLESEESWESDVELFRFWTLFIEGAVRTSACLATIDTDWYNAQLIFAADFYQDHVLAIETDLSVWAGEAVSFCDGWDEELLAEIENECQLFRLNDAVRRLITAYVAKIPALYATCKQLQPGQEYHIEMPELDTSA